MEGCDKQSTLGNDKEQALNLTEDNVETEVEASVNDDVKKVSECHPLQNPVVNKNVSHFNNLFWSCINKYYTFYFKNYIADFNPFVWSMLPKRTRNFPPCLKTLVQAFSTSMAILRDNGV